MEIIEPNDFEQKLSLSIDFNALLDQLVKEAKQAGVFHNNTSKIGNNLFDIQAGNAHLITNEEGLKEFNKQVIKKFEENENY